jgi:hypothetical protein
MRGVDTVAGAWERTGQDWTEQDRTAGNERACAAACTTHHPGATHGLLEKRVGAREAQRELHQIMDIFICIESQWAELAVFG